MADMEKNETMAEELEEIEETQAADETPSVEEPVKVPASEKKHSKKNAKPNFFVRLGRRLAKFARDCNSERKKIVWKPWREVCKSAAIVVVTVVAFSVVIAGIDYVAGNIFTGIHEWLSSKLYK